MPLSVIEFREPEGLKKDESFPYLSADLRSYVTMIMPAVENLKPGETAPVFGGEDVPMQRGDVALILGSLTFALQHHTRYQYLQANPSVERLANDDKLPDYLTLDEQLVGGEPSGRLANIRLTALPVTKNNMQTFFGDVRKRRWNPRTVAAASLTRYVVEIDNRRKLEAASVTHFVANQHQSPPYRRLEGGIARQVDMTYLKSRRLTTFSELRRRAEMRITNEMLGCVISENTG